MKYLGTSLLVILLTAVIANLGLIPSASKGSELYDGIFRYIAPLAIFFLLLEVNLKTIRTAGLPMIGLFLAGAFGTTVGSILGLSIVNAKPVLGEWYPAVGGMLTGTYIGGSVNYNAIALEFKAMENGNLYAGTAAIDNIITAIWMVLTIAIPRALQRIWPRKRMVGGEGKERIQNDFSTKEQITSVNLAFLIGGGILAIQISDWLKVWIFEWSGVNIPSVLFLTTIALLLAQFRFVRQLKGSKTLGMFSIYLFLAVIGAYCELGAVSNIGSLALTLLAIILIIVLTHGLITFLTAGIFKQDWEVAAIASQANIGGPSSALALAESLESDDLVLPSILIGSLGYGIGTYLGFFVAGILA
jgi:uncharacterized membrane protein